MPTLICLGCGSLMSWRNQRGARIADVRCACGHGQVRRAVWTPAGYVELRQAGGPSGRKLVVCAYCGRRRMAKGGVLWRPPVRVRLSSYRDGRDGRTIAAGTDICYRHHHDIIGECETPYDCKAYGTIGHELPEAS